jgi:hypothetical protein
MAIQSRWIGPTSLIPGEGRRWICDFDEATASGLYLWTVRFGDTYRINYVGIATQSIVERQLGHIRDFLQRGTRLSSKR